MDIKVTIIDRKNKAHEVDVPTDMNMNMMEVCKMYEFPVEGTCGGMALCASCHCYVESDTELSDMSDDEIEMLDSAFFVESNSRLGCQIKIKPNLEGLVIRLAPVD